MNTHERITIPLTQPVEWFGKQVTEICLEAPNAYAFFRIGDPITYIHSPNGNVTAVDELGAQRAYLDGCIKDIENGGAILALVGVKDALRIKKALLGFFRDTAETTSS